MNLYLWPTFAGEDKGDGGVRRVVEGQRSSLPRAQGVTLVDDPSEADVIACHIEVPQEFFRSHPDKPFVVHSHGLYWSEYEWEDWAYKANRKCLKSILTADITTAPTEWVADTIRRHTSRDVRVVPHGVSLRDWQPPGEHRGYVLWNKTRVDPVCEIDSLNALIKAAPDLGFVSTYADDAPNVTVTGLLTHAQAKDLIRHAGVYLVTTRETFGVGTLEAMACGVPVVGFNFGGQAEYVEHMIDGYLVEPGDIEGLRDGIKWCLEHRVEMAKKAREKAGQFTWANAAQQYKAIYRELVERYDALEGKPRTTIIVPAYKLEKYLPDTLLSIQEQTDKDWECIVVDDASPDRCGEIADEFALQDERFRVIHNPTNLYLAESRNVAITQANGRYILPLDADDMITPETVKTLADALDDDRSLQGVYGNVLFVDEDGKTPTNYGTPIHTIGHSGWPMPMDPLKQVGGANLMPYASMYRKHAWELVGGYRRRLRTAEDADFWTRLASWGFRMEMVTDADTLVYRNREGSMSRSNGDKRYDYLRWFPWNRDFSLAPGAVAGEKGISLLRPHVSIIIPVGPGHEKYVHDAIDSVAAQSYKYWECIVVNDTGATLPPLPAWVRVLECDARDVAVARNTGIAAARGKLYLPLDADDFLQPDALQWLISAYVQRGGDCIIYPDMFEDPTTEGVFKHYEFPDWSCQNLLTRMIHSVTALTPVQVWRDVGGYSLGMQWEDWDFQLKAAELGVCAYRIAAPLFTYRKWTGTRRNYDTKAELDARLAVINERWGPYRRGEKHFMGCGCQQGTVSPPTIPAGVQEMAMASQRQFGEAVLVEYTGLKQGTVKYKGLTGRFYKFSMDENQLWVHGEDAQLFTVLRDFKVIADTEMTPSTEVGGPVLVA